MNPRTVVILMTGLLLLATGLSADVIPVNNPSFEDTMGVSFLSCSPPSPCQYSVGGVPQWTSTLAVESGLFQPGPPANQTIFSFVPDGTTTAFEGFGLPGDPASTLSQTVGATVVNGFIYTLTVELGQRFDLPFGSSADLLLTGAGGSTMMFPAIGTVPTPGNWSTFTATFTGSAATAGDSITIQLVGTGGPQGNFDNVHLSAVPEPGYVGLLALGLVGLLAIAYFSRRRTAR